MHLATIISFSVSPHTLGQWRLPRSYRGYGFLDPDYWEHISRTLERGRFDMLFFADAYSVHDRYGGSPDAAVEKAVQYPRLDPLTLVPMLARATSHLGLAATASTTFLPPYWLARHFATLDHLTAGRVGWNVVTSYARSEARNFGLADIPDHDRRYDRADEFVELCNALWSSWDPDAVVFDRENGVYADPAKVHRIDHEGEYFSCAGPLHVPRSPQGRPLIIQAGSSPRGVAFAARHAEVHFSVARSPEAMTAHRDELDRALEREGRPPDALKVLWGILPVVGDTEVDARRKYAEIREAADLKSVLVQLSGHLNFDLSTWPTDRPLHDLDTSGIQAFAGSRDLTLRDVAERSQGGIGMPVVGTAEQIADRLEALYEAARGDGFMIVTHALPGSVDEFVDLVVPELQKRGRFRTAYAETQLRERFFPAAATLDTDRPR